MALPRNTGSSKDFELNEYEEQRPAGIPWRRRLPAVYWETPRWGAGTSRKSRLLTDLNASHATDVLLCPLVPVDSRSMRDPVVAMLWIGAVLFGTFLFWLAQS